jgi:hypothetical protein
MVRPFVSGLLLVLALFVTIPGCGGPLGDLEGVSSIEQAQAVEEIDYSRRRVPCTPGEGNQNCRMNENCLSDTDCAVVSPHPRDNLFCDFAVCYVWGQNGTRTAFGSMAMGVCHLPTGPFPVCPKSTADHRP